MSRPYWHYRDRAETSLRAQVSADLLMEHVRTIGAWERESGSPGEAQAYDYIERALKSYGLAVERREIEAYISLPEEGRVILPGAVIDGLTHAFSPSTDPNGLEGEVVDAGEGTPEDYARVSAAGKIALVSSLATPGKAWAAQQAGTIGQIFVNMDHLHNMIVTTIWGTPTPDTAWRIPRTPCLSIRAADAERLRALLHQGSTLVRLLTRVRTGWVPIPHLVGHLEGRQPEFVLFSGHVDAWHFGAMDNGTANATMLEVARLLGARRGALRRGMRFAFWSGHSHGRYAGSTWYADHFWHELYRRCVIHLNIDSTGARGATDYSVFHATEEAQGFAEAVVRDVTGQAGRARRFSRAGDQSFWGAGVPSALMSLSGIPRQDTELSRAMERLFGTSGFPWWWHTREDTVDKIDPAVLRLDTEVYVAAALRLVNAPVLPLDYARVARGLQATLEELQAGGRFDLRPAIEAAERLAARADALGATLDDLAGGRPGAAEVEAANRTLVRLSRVLVPLAYTTGDRFRPDVALPIPPLAGLQPARELDALDPASDTFKFTVAALVRERNRVVHALDEAADAIDDLTDRR